MLSSTTATCVCTHLHLRSTDDGHRNPTESWGTEAGYNVLVRGATSLLSQSGLANLERACDARVVVGGSLA